MQDPYRNIDRRYLAQIVDRQISADGARKYVLRLHDGALVEAVGMPRGGAAIGRRFYRIMSRRSSGRMSHSSRSTAERRHSIRSSNEVEQ